MLYVDRKMEVKFSIEEKVKGTHGGQDLYPYGSTYITSDNFHAQKNRYQDSVVLHSNMQV